MRNRVVVEASGVAINRRSRLKRLVLTGGSAAATAELRENDAAGPLVIALAAPAGQSFATELHADVESPLHVTLGGTGARLYIEYE